MHFPIIWIERILLLQVYFSSHFIAKQGTIFNDICFKQGTLFYSLVPPVVWFTTDLQIGHFEDRDHTRIIIYYEVFCIFSESICPKN